MPVYNSEKFVDMAIESILNQSYNNFEFILIDDGSEDDSYAIMETYQDPRIRLTRHISNKELTLLESWLSHF